MATLVGCAPKPFQLAPLAPAHVSYVCTPSLFFAFGSAALTEQSRKSLLDYLNSKEGCWSPVLSNPAYSIIIRGYADNSGAAEENMRLSLQRAEAARDFLVAHGMARDRIQVVGYGDTQPLVRTPGQEIQNRRATLSIALNGEELHFF